MPLLKRSWFLVLGVSLLAVVSGRSSAADARKITVLAAASLREAFEASAPAFKDRTGISVTFSFAGSDTLAAQIAQGIPADVFASANQTQMKRTADAGLLLGDATVFARNRLVIIVPQANPASIQTAADLGRPGVKVVLAAPTVPVGAYARAEFAKMNGTNGVTAGYSAAVEQNVVSNELDVKAVATKISLGEGDVGVVYATDVTPAIAPNIRTIAFPPGIAPDATYPIAVLKAATNPDGGRAFVNFVLHDGQAFLKARGFLAP